MTRGMHLLGFSALLLIAAAILFVSANDTRAAPPPFNPGGVVCFDNLDTAAECDGDSAPGSSSDISSKFCVGWGAVCADQPNPANIDESNFGAVAALIPTEFVPNSASSAPVGSIAGYLRANSVLGLINGPCGNPIEVAFSLMVGSINQSDTISPKAVGEPDPAEPLALDANGNGIPDGADKFPAYLSVLFNNLEPRARLFGVSRIQNSWVTLNFMFFNPGAHIVTKNAEGITTSDNTFDAGLGLPSITVLGDPTVSPSPGAISDFCAPLRSSNVTLGKTYNNPCSPLPADGASANCPNDATPVQNAGYPFLPCESQNFADEDGDGAINDGCPQELAVAESGGQCTNTTSDDPEDSKVNDGCPAVGDPEYVRIGACSGTDEGNCVIRQNPAAAGNFNFTTAAASQRDADSDGIENSLDVCSLDFNPDWNPHIADTVNDTDGDGLPNVCDPDPNQKSGQSPTGCKAGIVGDDQDKDCFANRADNCPNNNQLEDPNSPPDEVNNVPNIKDSDADGVGDACDPNVDQPNGENVGYCIQFTLAVGSPPAAVGGTRTGNTPDCFGTGSTQAPVVQTPPAGATAVPGSTSGGTGSGSGGGVGSGTDTGVGSLSPTNAGVPLWAALLAGIGGLGLLIGFGVLRRGYSKRRIQ